MDQYVVASFCSPTVLMIIVFVDARTKPSAD